MTARQKIAASLRLNIPADDDEAKAIAAQMLDAFVGEVRAAGLSEPERAMLRHALELAADAMANCPDEYNDDDSAALESLRRMATEGGEPA